MTLLTILLAAGLAGSLAYIYTLRKKVNGQADPFEDLPVEHIKEYVGIKNKQGGGTVEWTLSDEIGSLNQLYHVAIDKMKTTLPIPASTAKKYHNHHHGAGRTSGDNTCGVYLTLPEIFSGIISEFGDSSMSSVNYDKAAFYVYIIRYDGSEIGKPADQTSVVVQLAEDKGTSRPKGFASLYNYGDLCPPKCPESGTEVMH